MFTKHSTNEMWVTKTTPKKQTNKQQFHDYEHAQKGRGKVIYLKRCWLTSYHLELIQLNERF